MSNVTRQVWYTSGLAVGGGLAWVKPWAWVGFVLGNVALIGLYWVLHVYLERNDLRRKLARDEEAS